MKRTFFFLSVAVTTFICGCFLTWLRLGYTKPCVTKAVHSVISVEEPRLRKTSLEGIRATARGCGNGYGQGYELPDGIKLGEGNTCYSSFKEAAAEMRKWLNESDAILDRVGPAKKGATRKSERIVASFPTDEFGNKWVRIFWVQDQCIHWISGPNIEYALELEGSQYNPYKFDD